MPTEYQDRVPETPEQHPRTGMHALWYVAIVLSLIGNVYLLFSASHLSTGIAQLQESLSAQVIKVNEQIATSSEESRQHAVALTQEARQAAMAAAERAKAEAQRSAAKMSARLSRQQQEQQQQVTGELNDLKQATSTANSKINEVSGDVSNVKADVASTQSELQKTGSDLKRVMGDMGVMSGLIATNGKELAELRELGDRNYFEFDIKKASGVKKVGDISLSLRKADWKRNRFTVELLADDKRVEKRDRTINEPVQFYVAGSRQPYEIVVNAVKKDEVVGYLATPKAKLARR